MILALNRFFIPSLARVINSNNQQIRCCSVFVYITALSKFTTCFVANYPLPERTLPSAPPRGRANRQGLPTIRTIAPRQTRTRPLLPSLPRNIGPGSSGTLPTPGPLALAFHHCPGETS